MDKDEKMMDEIGVLIHEKLPTDMQFSLLVYDKTENKKGERKALYLSDTDRTIALGIMLDFLNKNVDNMKRKDKNNE